MSIAKPHPRQGERLEALYSFEVLDTKREKDFDDIVGLAAATCGTAISVVNFIDSDRQWFKAETGLGVRETPLATSLCSHVILEDDFVEIHDTLLDARMSDNPLCCGDPGLRFYAGALLKTPEGLPLGTLCVLDYQPKSLTPLQRDTIRVLANQVMAQLELRKTLRHAEVLRQEVDHRVKNSLQTISSLVRIASRTAREEETSLALSTIHSRIDAVARLHEDLYLNGGGQSLGIAGYVENLGAYFAEMAPPEISIDVSAARMDVTSTEAVAIGTLVNEFVANSLKHAFPGGSRGRIEIRVEPTDRDNGVRILCRDNGVGLPEGADLENGGLGMQIAAVISAELQGELQVNSAGPGLEIAFEFISRARQPGQGPASPVT